MKKLSMNMVAMGNLRHRKKRYVSLFISILLATTFACGAPLFLSCIRSSQETMRIRQVGRQSDITLHAQDVNWEEKSWFVQGDIGFSHSILYGWAGDRQDRGTAIAWMDYRARSLYHETVKEGRWPEAPGEIAMEPNALLRMGYSTDLGQKITLHTESPDGRAMEDRSFTVVGLLHDHRSNFERHGGRSLEMSQVLPAAFVCPQEPGSGYEDLTAFYNSIRYQSASLEVKEKTEAGLAPQAIYTGYYSPSGGNDPLIAVSSAARVSSTLSLLMAFLCCCGIANAFAGNLKERRTQIGMLRAIGATRPQIIRLFGREAVILCLVTAPMSLLLSYGGIKMISLFLGDIFTFSPDWKAILSGAGISVVCVLLSAILPLIVLSGISPMQAIRDVEKMRKMKKHRIRSRKSYDLAGLLAKRQLIFTRGRQILVGMILTLSVALGCILTEAFQDELQDRIPDDRSDFLVTLGGYSQGDNPYVNTLNLNPVISEAMAQEVLTLPVVERVSGDAQGYTINILRENVEDYFLLNEVQNGLMYKLHDLSREDIRSLESLRSLHKAPVTQEAQNFLRDLHYEQDFTSFNIQASSEDRIQDLQKCLIAGKINIEKLSSGEEILIAAPEEIGAYYQQLPDGSEQWGLWDMDPAMLKERKITSKELQYVWATTERPFQVGDTLQLSMVTEDPQGNIVRRDREVKVGGILKGPWVREFCIFTTINGLRTWYPDAGYMSIWLYFNQEVTEELNRQMQENLESMFPGFKVKSQYTIQQQTRSENRMFLAAFGMAMTALVTATVWLINNGITAQIREETRVIGTLRAVGAQPWELIKSYLLQILTVIFWATVAGILIALGWWLYARLIYGEETLPVLWPGVAAAAVTAMACLINLWLQIRKISRRSIVENIREL